MEIALPFLTESVSFIIWQFLLETIMVSVVHINATLIIILEDFRNLTCNYLFQYYDLRFFFIYKIFVSVYSYFKVQGNISNFYFLLNFQLIYSHAFTVK